MDNKVLCKNCQYYQPPNRPKTFSAKDANNPDIVNQIAANYRQLELREQQEIDQATVGDPFYHKPWFLPICLYWTKQGQKDWQKDAHGDVIPVYEVCIIHNSENDCTAFQPMLPKKN